MKDKLLHTRGYCMASQRCKIALQVFKKISHECSEQVKYFSTQEFEKLFLYLQAAL